MTHTVLLHRLGSVPYERAWEWQRETATALRDGRGLEALALLQHPPVYTLGRRTRPQHLLVDASTLQARGASVIEVDRGGDVTFHGPGQLVAYPILGLRRRGVGPVEYVRALESVVIAALARFGVLGERVPGRPGVWAGGDKIAAIGVRVQGGVTTHGFALNVDTDLRWFDAIVPCGLADVSVTSMARVLSQAPAMARVEDAVADAFAAVFRSALREADASRTSAGEPIISHGV